MAELLSQLHARAKTLTVDEWCDAWIRFVETGDNAMEFPEFPPEDVQRITNNVAGVVTMKAAGNFYRIFIEEVSRNQSDLDAMRVLDFGAGWGRIARYLLGVLRPDQISAVDVDDRLVNAGKEFMPGVDFQQIEPMGALPFPDQTFDVVYANSVFSHLSESANLTVVKEIARVMKPGGLFMGTLLRRRRIERWASQEATRTWIEGILGDSTEALRSLDAGGFLFGATKRWPDYGIAVPPETWIHEHWGKHFRIDQVRTDYTQNVPIAIRLSSSS